MPPALVVGPAVPPVGHPAVVALAVVVLPVVLVGAVPNVPLLVDPVAINSHPAVAAAVAAAAPLAPLVLPAAVVDLAVGPVVGPVVDHVVGPAGLAVHLAVVPDPAFPNSAFPKELQRALQ